MTGESQPVPLEWLVSLLGIPIYNIAPDTHGVISTKVTAPQRWRGALILVEKPSSGSILVEPAVVDARRHFYPRPFDLVAEGKNWRLREFEDDELGIAPMGQVAVVSEQSLREMQPPVAVQSGNVAAAMERIEQLQRFSDLVALDYIGHKSALTEQLTRAINTGRTNP